MPKPENTFINSVHKLLPPKEVLHREKMNNPYSSGTWDVWYSGVTGDLWIEYKYVVRVPKRVPFIAALSTLQLEWGNNRYNEGRTVAVVVGHTSGGIILTDLAWANPIVEPVFLPRHAIADWIMSITMASRINVEAVVRSSKGVDGGA